MGDTMIMGADAPREIFTKQEQKTLPFWDRMAYGFYNRLNTGVFIGGMAAASVFGGMAGDRMTDPFDPTQLSRDLAYVDAMDHSGAIFVPLDKMHVLETQDGKKLAVISAATERVDAFTLRQNMMDMARTEYEDDVRLNRVFGAVAGGLFAAAAMTMTIGLGLRARNTLRRNFPGFDRFACT